jgi:hypothetical protein
MSAKKARSKQNGTPQPNGANGDAQVSPDPLAEPITYSLSDEEIARKAYALWEERGRPLGSAEDDWFKAKEQLSA